MAISCIHVHVCVCGNYGGQGYDDGDDSYGGDDGGGGGGDDGDDGGGGTYMHCTARWMSACVIYLYWPWVRGLVRHALY